MSTAPAKQTPAIEAAFAEHRAFVRERLRGLGVAAADLDDATQDVFEVLVRRIADHDPNRPIRAWMAGMARKVARRYRDHGRRAVVPLDERAGPDDSPEDRAAQAEAWRVLQGFVETLEPERWSVFVLSEIEGLRGSEIAAELGINQNTVYARLRSARQAFERALRRHRARERRGVWAVLVWPRAAVLGGVALGGAVVVAGGNCSERSRIEQRPRSLAESAPAGSPLTVGPRAQPVLASDSAPTADVVTWIDGHLGFATGSNAKGERYTLSVESRHRLDGDRAIVELTYIGDDDVEVEAIGHELALDGLEIVDGEPSGQRTIPAGELEVVTTTLKATRDGVVRLRTTARHPNGGGSTTKRFAWVREHGRLRPCDEHECEAPIGDEQRSGERITVHVHNQCEVASEFVLFAGYPDLRPGDAVKVHSLQPDERRTLEIDAAQWFLQVDADGQVVGGGVQTRDHGARVTFFGTGDECSASSAASPNLPPWGDASPIRG